MDDEIKDSEWISAREVNRPNPKPKEPPKIDPYVSKIVGKPVLVNDPRLIAEVNKWRQDSHPDKFDNHLQNPAKQADLRRIFNKEYH